MQLQDFYLNEWLVQPSLNRATCGSDTVHLEPKIIDVLVYLAGRAGAVVSRDELMSEIWSDTIVLSDSLNRCISQIRTTFQTGCTSAPIIETIRKRGYRLVATIREAEKVEVSLPSPTDARGGNISSTLAGYTLKQWFRYSSGPAYSLG